MIKIDYNENVLWEINEKDEITRNKNGIKQFYSIEEMIGYGTESVVHNLVPIDRRTKSKAIKIFKPLLLDQGCNFTKEYFLSRKFDPNSIGVMLPIKAILIRKDDKNLLVQSKYEGKLASKVLTMTHEDQKRAISQIVKGVALLHSHNIVHKDITLVNIFYRRNHKTDEQTSYFISDFGEAQESPPDMEKQKRSDLQALAFVLRSLLLKSPYGCGDLHDSGHNIPKELARLVEKMNLYDPMTIEEVKPQIDQFLKDM